MSDFLELRAALYNYNMQRGHHAHVKRETIEARRQDVIAACRRVVLEADGIILPDIVTEAVQAE